MGVYDGLETGKTKYGDIKGNWDSVQKHNWGMWLTECEKQQNLGNRISSLASILSFKKYVYAINLDKGVLGEGESMIINIMEHAALKMKKKIFIAIFLFFFIWYVFKCGHTIDLYWRWYHVKNTEKLYLKIITSNICLSKN